MKKTPFTKASLNKTNDEELVESPCISNCCLDEDDICMGCFRHIDEITGWHSANNEQRKAILLKTQARKDKRSGK